MGGVSARRMVPGAQTCCLCAFAGGAKTKIEPRGSSSFYMGRLKLFILDEVGACAPTIPRAPTPSRCRSGAPSWLFAKECPDFAPRRVHGHTRVTGCFVWGLSVGYESLVGDVDSVKFDAQGSNYTFAHWKWQQGQRRRMGRCLAKWNRCPNKWSIRCKIGRVHAHPLVGKRTSGLAPHNRALIANSLHLKHRLPHFCDDAPPCWIPNRRTNSAHGRRRPFSDGHRRRRFHGPRANSPRSVRFKARSPSP